MNPLTLLPRLADKAGALGAVVSAMGCGMCCPALASIGATLGLVSPASRRCPPDGCAVQGSRP